MGHVGVGWVIQGWGGVEFNLLQTQEIITHMGLKSH